MKKFTLFISILLVLFLAETSYAQEERKSAPVENEITQISLTTNGNIVRLQNADKNSILEIYNVLGVKVASIKIDSSDKTITLNLPKGCYILKIENIVRKIAIK